MLEHTDRGSGPPVVLLGGPYRAALLDSTLAPVLVEAGFRVVTAQQRGTAATVADMAADVAALVDGLGLGRCAVVGDFLGALVALELAATRPELVDRVVLSAARTAPSTLCRGMHEELISRLEAGETIEPAPLSLLRALQLYSPRRLADDAFLAGALRMLRQLPLESPEELDSIRAGLSYEVRPERFAALDVPVLLLAYEFDAITPPHQSRALAQHLRDARVELFDLGHGGVFEEPARVGAAIGGFLR